ncbi:MAG: TraB/GumN family protein [Candidatus Diapherotrites archaeon]|nr:TraB/GumN family protein [Candidatus Diapherotrites archaeon]
MKVERIFLSGKEVILVGTAHVSLESVELAKRTIEEERPDVVGVELDSQRYAQLSSGEKWRELNIGEVIRSGQSYLLLVNLLLSNIQKKMGDELGVKPGAEMIESINKASELGIPVELLDRNIKTTFSRAMNAMGLLEKLRFFYFLFMAFFGVGSEKVSQKKLDELKETDALNSLLMELGKAFPSLKRVLVDERDKFIAQKIRQSSAKKIVAVIGLGHMGGVKENLMQEHDLKELVSVEKKKSIFGLAKYAIPALFVLLFGYIFFSKGLETGLYFLALWVLVNGTLSALGVIIARGHILSAATAFLAAPLTTLHPFLAAGWFAGLMEARIKNPKIRDFEELKNIASLGDFSKNAVTRILLVVALSNLGASLGSLVFFPLAAKVFL